MRTRFIDKAREAWGSQMPGWVLVLAEQVDRSSLKAVAKKIGYSLATVSYVIANKYAGDLDRVAAKVSGALMNETVVCPILGEIGRDHCLDEQKKNFVGTSSIRSKLFRACRSGCVHSRIEKGSAS